MRRTGRTPIDDNDANHCLDNFEAGSDSRHRAKLEGVTIRYYYTADDEKPQNFWCDWSDVGQDNISGTFHKVEGLYEGADKRDGKMWITVQFSSKTTTYDETMAFKSKALIRK